MLHVGVELLHLVEAGFIDILVGEVVDQVPECENAGFRLEHFSPFRANTGKEFYLTVKQFRHREPSKRLSPKIVKFGRDSNELSEEMNIHAAAAYAAHLLTARSTAGHGVHSPLMFSFITEVIGGRADRNIIEEGSKLRREMLSDSRVVRVTDLGAGSSVMQGRERSIRQIASVAALPPREFALLARMAASLDRILERVPARQVGGPQQTFRSLIDREAVVLQSHEQNSGDRPGKDYGSNRLPAQGQELTSRTEKDFGPDGRPSQGLEPTGRAAYNPENTPPGELLQPENRPVILELGTSLGISTLALAMAAPDRRVITVEGCPELAAIARENLRRHGASNTEVLNMEFSQALSYLKERGTQVGMVFIDGNHRGAALTEYVSTVRELGEEMIIVADDIHMNRDMITAWKSLYEGQHAPRKAGNTGEHARQRQASLETSRLGILFCLRNLTPGHYRIRY
jgi:precorrin-6B methylase 2